MSLPAPESPKPGALKPHALKPDALKQERQRQVRGLILLAVAAIVFSVLRAGVHRVFTPGWWRLW